MDTEFDLTGEERAQQYRTLLEVSESIAAHRDLPDLFHEIAQSLHRVVRFAYMRLILYDAERNVMRVHLLEAANPSADVPGCQDLPVEDSPGGWVWQTQRPLVVSNLENETRFPKVTALLRQQGYAVLLRGPAYHRAAAVGSPRIREPG